MAFHVDITSQLNFNFSVAPKSTVVLNGTSSQAHLDAVVAPFGPFCVHQMGACVPASMYENVPWSSQFPRWQGDGDVCVGHRRFSRLNVDRPPLLLPSADTDADIACDGELWHDVLRS